MTKTKKPATKRAHSPTRTRRNRRQGASPWSWAAIAAPIVLLVVVVVIDATSDANSDVAIGSTAPSFDLPTTEGARQTLDSVLNDGEALLYFSMGLGCDGCFLQIPEIAQPLSEKGITLVPVMVDPAPLVAEAAGRFGIATPILIDADRAVSGAYGMIGIYGHSDRPSHSFALVDQQARITWVGHYAEMFVPMDRLLSDLQNQS